MEADVKTAWQDDNIPNGHISLDYHVNHGGGNLLQVRLRCSSLHCFRPQETRHLRKGLIR